jgi:AraC family transcriptional activator of pobA
LNRRLPFQKMLQDLPLQVLSLNEVADDTSYRQHRHSFYMLFWITKGAGVHQVNFRNFEIAAGQVLFIQEGQVHRVLRQPADGTIILFNAAMFRAFMVRHPSQEQHGLFDYLNRQYTVELDRKTRQVFNSIVPLLKLTLANNAGEALTADYLSVMLYQLNQLFRPLPVLSAHPSQVEIIRQLKHLIDRNYLTERTTPFYAKRLSIVDRKLNQLAVSITGKLVKELIQDRLLSEAEALLGGTALTIKEITFELGFIDHAHFAFFFRKHKGIAPSAFRKTVTR